LARVLFIGVEWFTRQYARAFEGTGTEYWTLDIDPDVRSFGAGRLHIVGSVTELDRHFSEGFFDAVILNGVFGFGVDDVGAMNAAVAGCALVLRPKGILVIGWNPDRTCDPLELAGIQQNFSPDPEFPLPRRVRIHSFDTHEHVYDMFACARRAHGGQIETGRCPI
jgi:hypothetical protein